MPNWLRDAGTLTAMSVLGLGVAVALVVVAIVLLGVASLWMSDPRRAQALAVLDRFQLVVATLRGCGPPTAGPPSPGPDLGAAGGP